MWYGQCDERSFWCASSCFTRLVSAYLARLASQRVSLGSNTETWLVQVGIWKLQNMKSWGCEKLRMRVGYKRIFASEYLPSRLCKKYWPVNVSRFALSTERSSCNIIWDGKSELDNLFENVRIFKIKGLNLRCWYWLRVGQSQSQQEAICWGEGDERKVWALMGSLGVWWEVWSELTRSGWLDSTRPDSPWKFNKWKIGI